MNDTDLPYGPIRAALNTVLGRVGLVMATILLGWMLGAWSAAGSMHVGLLLLPELPAASFLSFLFGHGYITWPAILVFGIAFVRRELVWRWLLLPLLLAWWNYHATLDYIIYRSPAARSGENWMRQVEEKPPRRHVEKKAQ